jgi:hypothetical protein
MAVVSKKPIEFKKKLKNENPERRNQGPKGIQLFLTEL